MYMEIKTYYEYVHKTYYVIFWFREGGRVDGLAKSQPTGAQLESPDAIRSHIVLTHTGLTLGWGRFLTQ